MARLQCVVTLSLFFSCPTITARILRRELCGKGMLPASLKKEEEEEEELQLPTVRHECSVFQQSHIRLSISLSHDGAS